MTAETPAPIALEDMVTALGRAPLLRDVEAQQLRLLAFSGREGEAAPGGRIVTRGDRAAPAILVTAGEVETGGARHGPGALLNAASAIARHPAAQEIRAATAVRYLAIDHALVSRLIREYPAMGRAMMRALGQELRGIARTVRTEEAAARFRADNALRTRNTTRTSRET